MDPLIIALDILSQPAYGKNVSNRVFRISYTDADVTGAVVKQLPISTVTVDNVRPKIVYIQPQLGAQLLFGFQDVTENNITNEFSLQKGEFVTQPWAFSIPSDPTLTTMYFLMKSLPAAGATTGEVNLSFHGGY
jgi:hypothetical protein